MSPHLSEKEKSLLGPADEKTARIRIAQKIKTIILTAEKPNEIQ
jgi:hypothetical protein